MKRHNQLSPPRLGRGELFYVAERYLEGRDAARNRQDVKAVAKTPIETLAGSSMLAYTALGSLFGRPFEKLFEERRSYSHSENDRQALAAELYCRDLERFSSLDELARHIVTNERPS